MSMTNRQVSDHFRALELKDRKELERRLGQAKKRNAGPRNARDGYPTGATGSGQDSGDPVGAVATTNVSTSPAKDPLADHVEAAEGYLLQAVTSLGAMRSRLNAIDRLTDDSDLNPEPGCWAMARVGVYEPAHVMSDAKGAIAEPRPWGRWAHDYVLATGQVPTVEQCRDHAEGRRVKLKASA